MDVGEFTALFLEEHDYLVTNWQKRKKGFNHHDARRIAREAMVNVLVGKTKSRKPSDEVEGGLYIK